MVWEGGVVAIGVMNWIDNEGLDCFGVLVMDVMFLGVNLFMLFEILGSLERFATNIAIVRF